jgi:hypothetical protein
MCYFTAIGIKSEHVGLLLTIGDYWECKNKNVTKINEKLIWNWLIEFDSQCSCKLFEIKRDKNTFKKIEEIIDKAMSCIIVHHFYNGNQNEEELILGKIIKIPIEEFKEHTQLQIDIPIKVYKYREFQTGYKGR